MVSTVTNNQLNLASDRIIMDTKLILFLRKNLLIVGKAGKNSKREVTKKDLFYPLKL